MQEERGSVEAGCPQVGHKEEEISVVVIADAVVDPGAVVVHLEDAAFADVAVVGAWGAGNAAFFAEAVGAGVDGGDGGVVLLVLVCVCVWVVVVVMRGVAVPIFGCGGSSGGGGG